MEEIEVEISLLKARQEKLTELILLRQDVSRLEKGPLRQMGDSDAMKTILTEVAQHFHIHPDMLLIKNRESVVATPRQAFCWLAREITGLPFSVIGMMIKRGHGTVLNACKRMCDRIETEPMFREQMQGLKHRCLEKITAS